MDRTKEIYGNKMSKKVIKKAERSKKKYSRRFGNDEDVDYMIDSEENTHIEEFIGVRNIVITNENKEDIFHSDKGIIIGNIRMGFGHYRIAMAIASAAHAMGYIPYWLDLNSFQETTGGKVIQAQNQLYSLGSRLSGKSKVFNKLMGAIEL